MKLCRRCFVSTTRTTSQGIEYKESKILCYTADEFYRVVSNVEKYHEFVPYCLSSRVLRTWPHSHPSYWMDAELTVGFGFLAQTKYTSRVFLDSEKYQVMARVIDTPLLAHENLTRENLVMKQEQNLILRDHPLFRHLSTQWLIEPIEEKCRVHFETRFAFKSVLYAQMSSLFFDDVVKVMVRAFERQCQTVYRK